MTKDILLVEDEAPIREMVKFAIGDIGFRLREAGNAERAEAMIGTKLPDLLLLDWMLPGTSGLDLARRLKADRETRHVPIIMLTALGEEGSRIQGLEAGVDDYVTKPFSPRELLLRIKAVLRRSGGETDDDRIEVDGLVLDWAAHRVLAGEREIPLGPTEFRLLQFFMTHPERVYSRGQLLDRVWGRNIFIEERTVDVHIRRLRKALTPFRFEDRIQTVRGVGYRFSGNI